MQPNGKPNVTIHDVSGGNNMARKLGLIRTATTTEDVMEAALDDEIDDAW